MHVQPVLLDTSWLHNVWEMFLPFITSKFLWKNGVPRKIKAHLPQQPQALQQLFSPHVFNFIQKFFSPTQFKKEGRDYAFYMREYKVETIKLLPFYMTHFLFTEQLSHNIWRKLKNHMKDDIPNNIFPSHLHISDPNLL